MIIPYLTFHGNCQEAITFYEDVFRTKSAMIQYYDDYQPDDVNPLPDHLSEWILHAEMKINDQVVWLADDTNEITQGHQVKLSLVVKTKKEALEIFSGLSHEGIVTLPPIETFYSSCHAAVIDRFGISWHIVAEEK
ncbi:MAG: hypothetical protein A2Y45_06085 [Tenericutes bacterium GWC2_34_14]|nr:MAG: hypothetical protein A2Z84_04140 [Tenericutes bacterium GWA2_35_7]OHE28524.1 MAG: hypothetical protein A2Y45_06085 [Tenericutes bacterium GWC2_34_14]OHE33568.1 MAG: hypothetical protein A2012_03725 [Tenericutes bacterium GWE2_34_108]OHE36853.1 MAG: hypothetical protein A2Y46_09525 [Tenericutes bacterium GWF1_35_14]OHE38067.1 MAG: hypothetical protein A2Y44_09140 [Tenericutes bacterium GWF2_35_184]OHE42090.1 MAG: hypothetical protein A3K26_07965 [Tenericutes bacterium RIFOXYA12_FULL_35_